MNNCQHIIFTNEAYNAIIAETRDINPNETGGILLGHILDNGIWIVMEVLPPGPDSIFQRAYFEYDERFVNYLAQSVATKYEHELSLLGLWHRHPGSMDIFSGTDDGTNRVFAGLNPQGAISGIVNVDPRFRLTMYHCANPFGYTKVEYTVGDKDLIPDEYFKLKYYDDGKEPNPYLSEKKNNTPNTEKKYEIGSPKENSSRKNANDNSKKDSRVLLFLDSKNVFFLLFLMLLVASVLTQYSFNQVKKTEGIGTLHKIIFSEYPEPINVLDIERIREQAAREVGERRTRSAVVPTDSVFLFERENFAHNHLNRLSLAEEDSVFHEKIANLLETIYNDKWINRENALARENAIAERMRVLSSGAENVFDIEKAERKVRRFVIALWIFTVLSLLIAFSLRKRKTLRRMFKTEKKHWYQKYKKLYHDEEAEIKKGFPNAKEEIDSDGTLSYFISTGKQIEGQSETLSYMLVYADDYHKNKAIKIYLVAPDLNEMLGENANNFPYVKTDKTGTMYLDFNSAIAGQERNGALTVCKLNEWVKLYNRWQSQEIRITDIKL